MAHASFPGTGKCKMCKCWQLKKALKLKLCSNCYVRMEIEWLLVTVPKKVEMTIEDYVNTVLITMELEK